MLKKTAQKGFTIVELLIVIVVIGILAALVLNTFTGVQKRARDTDRQNDITQLATQLEVYYNDNGHYPTVANLQDSAANGWVRTNLKGLDVNALTVQGQTGNGIIAYPGASFATPTPNYNQYAYSPLQSDGTTSCTQTDGSDCAKFRLRYNKEQPASGETNPIVKESLN